MLGRENVLAGRSVLRHHHCGRAVVDSGDAGEEGGEVVDAPAVPGRGLELVAAVDEPVRRVGDDGKLMVAPVSLVVLVAMP